MMGLTGLREAVSRKMRTAILVVGSLLVGQTALLTVTANAETTKTVFNPFTGRLDYITSLDGSSWPGTNISGCLGNDGSGSLSWVACSGSSGGAGGLVNNGSQYSAGYYSVAGSSNVISAVAPIAGNLVLTSSGTAGPPYWSAVSGTSSGGSSGNVQYNNGSGGFAGSANMTFDGSNLSVGGHVNVPDTAGYYLGGSPFAGVGQSAPFDYGTYVGAGTGGFNAYSYRINTCIGGMSCNSLGALSSYTGQDNVAIGYQAATTLSTGNRNVLVGDDSGEAMTSATDNLCLGNNSCFNATDDIKNVAIGSNAGFNLNHSNGNIFIGYIAGQAATSAQRNVCIGYDSCDLLTTGQNNVILGNVSGADITSGWMNTCIGGASNAFQPCQGIVTGSSNTMVGSGAGGYYYSSLHGDESENIVLGLKGGMGPGVNGSICIGNNCTVLSSNTAVIGGTGVDAVNVHVTSLTIDTPSLWSQNCLGTSASGNIQAGTCGTSVTKSTESITYQLGDPSNAAPLVAGTTTWFHATSSGTLVGASLDCFSGTDTFSINVSSSTSNSTSTLGLICASACPALSASSTYNDTTLSGWATSFAQDGYLAFCIPVVPPSCTYGTLKLRFLQ